MSTLTVNINESLDHPSYYWDPTLETPSATKTMEVKKTHTFENIGTIYHYKGKLHFDEGDGGDATTNAYGAGYTDFNLLSMGWHNSTESSGDGQTPQVGTGGTPMLMGLRYLRVTNRTRPWGLPSSNPDLVLKILDNDYVNSSLETYVSLSESESIIFMPHQENAIIDHAIPTTQKYYRQASSSQTGDAFNLSSSNLHSLKSITAVNNYKNYYIEIFGASTKWKGIAG
tara:strand:+ start:4232 stop:4915 length:684 start_codon:yes stop_codon:yes gene_type:complete